MGGIDFRYKGIFGTLLNFAIDEFEICRHRFISGAMTLYYFKLFCITVIFFYGKPHYLRGGLSSIYYILIAIKQDQSFIVLLQSASYSRRKQYTPDYHKNNIKNTVVY